MYFAGTSKLDITVLHFSRLQNDKKWLLSGFSRKCEIKGEKLITCRWQLIRLKRTSFTAQLPAFIGGIQGPPWKNVSFVVNKKSISVHFENPGKEMGP